MAFIVDGSEWMLDGLSSDDVRRIVEGFLERVSVARKRRELVLIGDDFATRTVRANMSIWDLCVPSLESDLPREIQQELSSWIDRAGYYLDGDWPKGFGEHDEITFEDGVVSTNTDLVWSHHCRRDGRTIGMLSLSRNASRKTTSSLGVADIFWMCDENGQRSFWRSELLRLGNSAADFTGLAEHAFPDLYFHPDVWSGLNKFIGGLAGVLVELVRHLSVLDDHGAWAFTFPPPALRRGEPKGEDETAKPSNQIVEERFSGLRLNISPEKPSVRLRAKFRVPREVMVSGRVLYCSWHTKLEKHQNRIHIHEPVDQSDNRLVVGIFCGHLPLPGDKKA